jgi:aspartate carbamoyltransferase catalytic subunit
MRSLLRSNTLDVLTVRRLILSAQGFVDDLEKARSTGKPFHNELLKGKTVTTLFHEASTRTRLSFELAAMNLGANVLPFPVESSSLLKGESLEDTLETLIAMGVDAVVLRHAQDGIHLELDQHTHGRLALLNAGDGMSDHPTQGLLDVLTLYQQAGCSFDDMKKLRLGIVGDIKHSRVVAATLTIAQTLGVSLKLYAPDALAPSRATLDHWKTTLFLNDSPEFDVECVLAEVDVVMALRLQKERLSTAETPEALEALVRQIQLTPKHLARHARVKFMHPGPVNWGAELHVDLATHPKSLIHQQVRNGVAMRMACLLWALLPLP